LWRARSDAIFAAVGAFGESQIYRDLMRFKPDGLSPNGWAVKAGVSRTVWSDMRRHGNPSRRTLEKLLGVVGSSLAEFEALRLGPEPRQLVPAAHADHVGDARGAWTPARLPALPLVASRLGGEWGGPDSRVEVTEIRPRALLDRLPRPQSLATDPDAFAITVVGDAMRPRFRPGMRIAISPRLPAAVGDEVLVRLRDGAEPDVERGLVMQLVRRTASGFELRQFNPDRTAQLDAAAIDAVFKIVGELI
jgi:hypothetical protein